MIGPGAGTRVMVATRPVDFRKGPDALAALVSAAYGGDPYSGVIYVFRAKRADRIKLVWWDATGLCLMEADLPEDIEVLRALALEQSCKLADVTVAKGEAEARIERL